MDRFKLHSTCGCVICGDVIPVNNFCYSYVLDWSSTEACVQNLDRNLLPT
ncbi:hypothetical protein CSKR_201457 [Clonorchis sinensis]|uniref:Uncharacterized protein n=2 Tax=Clonorchis sinensis TaxID=79923 RepID=A0A8T1MQ95_CLOSI|nr:hypothetical protein CSKR_201457 [Clonorchis sinensis]